MDKKIEMFLSRGVALKYGDTELAVFVLTKIREKIRQDGFDFYKVFVKDGQILMQRNGYNLFDTTKPVDEIGITERLDVPATTYLELTDECLWGKVDDYGDRFIVTLLFPNEY